jgi:nicotinamide riboside kinase
MPSYQDQQSNHEKTSHLSQHKTQHALYPREDWLLECANGDTALPYWDWVEMVRGQGLQSIQHACR